MMEAARPSNNIDCTYTQRAQQIGVTEPFFVYVCGGLSGRQFRDGTFFLYTPTPPCCKEPPNLSPFWTIKLHSLLGNTNF
jgi:hypothetical protein